MIVSGLMVWLPRLVATEVVVGGGVRVLLSLSYVPWPLSVSMFSLSAWGPSLSMDF